MWLSWNRLFHNFVRFLVENVGLYVSTARMSDEYNRDKNGLACIDKFTL